jgi:hypothetical protein
MRRACSPSTLLSVNSSTHRVIMDAAIDRAVIHGTLTAPSGDRRDFYGWLELNTALETMLDSGGVVCAFEAKPSHRGRGHG